MLLYEVSAMDYEKRLLAICYEAAIWYSDKQPSVRLRYWYRMLLDYCKPYWVEWKTLSTMESVDRQAEVTREEWKEVDDVLYVDPVFSEKPSEVDGLTEMRLSAPWSISTEKSEGST